MKNENKFQMMSRLGKNICCFTSDVSVKYFKGLGLIENTFWRKVFILLVGQ